MYKCPINYYNDNLIFTDNGCWGAFEIEGFDYKNKKLDTKINILSNLIRFIANINVEAKILIIPKSQDIKGNYEKLRSELDKQDPLCETTRAYIDMTEEYLLEDIKENGNINDYKTYILTNLTSHEEEDIINKLKDSFDYLVKDPVNAINNFLNLDKRIILDSKMNHFKKLSNGFFADQNKRIKLRVLNENEIQWLCKRVMFRGINKDIKVNTSFRPYAKREEDQKGITPLQTDVKNLFEGKIKQKSRYLEIEHSDNSRSFQTFLSISAFPDEIKFPDEEYLLKIQDLFIEKEQVIEEVITTEVCINIDRLTEYDSKSILSNKKREIDSQIDHISEAGEEIPDEILEAKAELMEFDGEIRNNRLPIIKTSITFCIASDNEEELDRKAKYLKSIYEDMNFNIVQPLTDQYKLFMEFIPGARRYTNDFVIPLPVSTLAGAMFGANTELGDKNGFYIGTTGILMKKVFLNMARACLENKSASATIFGDPGYGKSFNASLLLVLHVLHGGYGLVFDPKAERSNWERDLPWLKGLTSTIKLSSDDKYRGMLDPFIIYKDDVEEACNLALNIISELYNLSSKGNDEEFIVLNESLEKMKKEDLKSMNRLAEILNDFPETDDLYKDAKRLARKLFALKENGMTKLFFGTGTEKALQLNNRLNILQIENLNLPAPTVKKEEYTRDELLSTVLIMVMGSFAKKFALTERNVYSSILFDESWLLSVTTEGKKLYNFLTRMGRSLFTGCIFNGHSVLDIPSEEIKNTINYKFCFHTESKEEAKRMLEYMNMDVTEENINLIMTLENRQCVFQDLDKRVGILTFDAIFKDFLVAFDTTPKTKKDVITNEKENEKKN